MVLPMMVGCAAACIVGFGVLRLDLDVIPVGVAFSLGATALMTIPMAAWMRLRMHHSWANTVEMSAWMLLPLIVLAPYAAGLVSGVLLCPLVCGGMVIVMLALMLARWPQYSHRHDAHAHMH